MIKMFLSVVFCITFTFSVFVRAEVITVGADVWCPYNCDPGNHDKPGFMVELAREIFAMHGIAVRYEVLPWSRAKIQVSINNIQGLIAGTPANTADLTSILIFPKEEQARMQNKFFTLKINHWQYDGVDSLSDIELGVIQGYDYGSIIQPYINLGVNVQVISGDDALERLMQMLAWGRIDAILEDESVFRYTAQIHKFNNYKYAGNDGSSAENNNLYIALSPSKNSKKYAKMLTAGMITLRQSGRLDKILARYGLKDWK